MDRFFDERAASYDEHMRAELERFHAFYAAAVAPIPETDTPIEILDLGIGTGLELPGILERAPRASITGIDISKAMLDRLRAKFLSAEDRLRLIRGSFLDADLGEKTYDVVVSSMALHHWMPDRKLGLYERIRRSLRPSGLFVNGDFIRGGGNEEPLPTFPGATVGAEDDLVHVDHPLPVDTEMELLRRSGFGSIDVVFRMERAAVLVGRRPA